MRAGRLTIASLAMALLTGVAPLPSVAAPRLSRIASGGVLAARVDGKLRTAFAFRRPGVAIVAAGSESVQLIDSAGAAASGAPSRREGSLAAIDVSGLRLAPLIASAAHGLPGGARAYVIGQPLGYEADRIRAVRLPRLRLASARLVGVTGKLARSFAGAPVVDLDGRVVGAVARVGAHSWQLAPLGRLFALTAVRRRALASEAPILAVVGGGVLLFLAGAIFGAMRYRRWRQRAHEADQRRARRRASSAASVSSQQPLVRLRASPRTGAGESSGTGEGSGIAGGAAAGPRVDTGGGSDAAGESEAAVGSEAACEEADDFDVILKSRGQT